MNVRDKTKMYHINMLKKFYRRQDDMPAAAVSQIIAPEPQFFVNAVGVCIVEMEDTSERPCI